MKKIQTLLLAISLLVLASACRHRGHTIIRSSDGSNVKEVEYGGRMVFNSDNSISGMSPRSFLKYKHNNEELEVNCDKNGLVTYALNDSAATKTLDEDGKQLLTEAIKEILKTKRQTRH